MIALSVCLVFSAIVLSIGIMVAGYVVASARQSQTEVLARFEKPVNGVAEAHAEMAVTLRDMETRTQEIIMAQWHSVK